jgi:SAM-dependent methyltransferase
MTEKMLNPYFDLAIERKMYASKPNLAFHLDYIFGDTVLAGKKVLDVGGGAGLLSIYAAVNGAKKVICLEPECDGSSSGMINDFNGFKSALSDALPAELLPLTLQQFLQQSGEDEFDVVVLHNSINHLDEEACINLQKSDASYNTYKAVFAGVYYKMKPGGIIIIADCSCSNFYNDIGVKNVFVPTIEWHKHQQPGTWIALLKEVGFRNPRVEWSTPNRFGEAGRLLMGNSVMAYFTSSHFKFRMEK